jgi:hypothetical protein
MARYKKATNVCQILQWKLLNVIILRQTETNNNYKKMI